MRAILRTLGKKFLDLRPRRDIYDRAGARIYLRRWHVLGGYEAPLSLMVHQMLQPDDDACHHDHPWTFVTLVLAGGYVEHITRERGDVRRGESPIGPGIRSGTIVVERKNPSGTIRRNPAEHTHRIDRLPTAECWTLVLRFPKRRS